MVIKGRARGGPSALAAHLERRDTNEIVRVMELRGVSATDVRGALREMDCMGSGAKSVRTLYHAAINTAPGERLTDDQKRQAADRLEKELGFSGQPRVIVEHVKKNREHMHVVFLRIDTERMVAIPDSHNYRKHEMVARDLEREFAHRPVQGVHIDRQGRERPKRTPSHDEMQQAERSGLTPQQAKEQITRLWHQADSGKAFAASLDAEGWVLAKGDRRDFVLVDSAGETHSLARRIDGAKAVDLWKHMADIDPANLLTVETAKAMQRPIARSHPAANKEIEKTRRPASIKPGGTVTVLRMPAPVRDCYSDPILPSERKTQSIGDRSQRKKQKLQQIPKSLRHLYTTATGITQRVFDKAKGWIDKKLADAAPDPPHRVQAPARTVQWASPTRPSSNDATLDALKPVPKLPAQSREKRKQTREELDGMIGRQRDQANARMSKLSREKITMPLQRQRRQREHSSPSR
jgi:hypothetical protein